MLKENEIKTRPKAIIFYQYLPPWRIDVFNEMGKYYNLIIVFTNADCEGFTYDRDSLLKKLNNIKTIFLNNGFKIGSRPIRFGIFRIINEYKPDVIFSHEYSPTSIIVALYKQLSIFKYKYFITTSDNLKMAETATGLKAKSRAYVLRNADGIIVYSKVVEDWYKEHFNNLKTGVCPNIQNPDSLLSYRKSFSLYINEYKNKYNLKGVNIMLYTGRLVEVKGLDLLLNAFAKANIPNYKLVIVGEGNQKERLIEQTIKLGIKDKVIFAGYYTGEALYAWYDLANFFILPSRYEPFGAVVNEALVYGCPVMASKYIGALDFISENNGLVFNPLDELDFCKTIKEACFKYADKPMNNRKDLMIRSFDNYVKVFQTINS